MFKRKVFNTCYIKRFLIKYRDSLHKNDTLRGDINRVLQRIVKQELKK